MQDMRTRKILALSALGLVLAAAGCSSGGKTTTLPPAGGGGGGTTTGGGGGGGGGGNGYEGTLTTSGLYAANWTVPSGTEADPLNSYSSAELTSDKQTFGHVGVKPDGSIEFGSGAPEFGGNLSFTGKATKVTMDPSNMYVCAFTVDTDLTGEDGKTVLHMSGGLTVHWHPEGLGDAHCP